MTGPKPLPELHQSTLDAETLDALFADLEACTEILAVLPKAGPGHTQPENIALADGRDQLLSGQLRGLQIRYRYQGEEWWDTLIHRGNSIHITRIQQNYG